MLAFRHGVCHTFRRMGMALTDISKVESLVTPGLCERNPPSGTAELASPALGDGMSFFQIRVVLDPV